MGLIAITMETLKAPRKAGRPLSFDRQAALQQAMLCFWRHGYEATSITELTQAMGITAPSLYTAFGDKKHLFLEAARLYAGDPADMAATLAAAPTARGAALDMLTASARAFTGEATPRGCLLASSPASVSEAAGDVQAAVSKVRLGILRLVEGRIAQDVARGVLPATTPVAGLAAMVVGLIQAMSVLARDGLARADLIAMAEVAMQAWPQPPVQG